MIRRLSVAVLAAGLVLTVYACSDSETTAPATPPAGSSLVPVVPGVPSDLWQGHSGQHHHSGHHDNGGNGHAYLVQCESHPAYVGSGDIGPSGGQIIVGAHRLIIPPGALTHTTHITANAPAGDEAFIDFEPEGLTFRKPAGLIFNTDDCSIPTYTPDVVYLDDAGNVLEHIDALYSPFWHVVAAPITHFSGYAVAW